MWIAYKTIIVKEILRFSRIWVQTIFPPIITTSLYLLNIWWSNGTKNWCYARC